MEAVFLSAVPYQCKIRVAKLKKALEAMRLELQSVSDLAAEIVIFVQG